MNVILSDQLRADCVGCYGNPIIQTPNINALAATGSRFSLAFSQHPQCAPSRASLLTGRYPHVNSAVSNHTTTASQEITLGEYFRSAGYKSIGVGKLHLFPKKEEASFDETKLTSGQQSGTTSPTSCTKISRLGSRKTATVMSLGMRTQSTARTITGATSRRTPIRSRPKRSSAAEPVTARWTLSSDTTRTSRSFYLSATHRSTVRSLTPPYTIPRTSRFVSSQP